MRFPLKTSFLTAVILSCILLFSGAASAEKQITIGGKNFTEQYILPEIAKQLLENKGFKVDLKTGVSTSIARKSLESGQIDLYFEYTGTAYTVFHKQKDAQVMADPQKVFDWVRLADEKKGLTWLDKSALNNTYTMMMKQDRATAENIKTISDLGEAVNKDPKKLSIAVSSEFWERPDGIKKLMKVYGFRMKVSRIKKMDPGITYMAIKNDQVDIAMGFATDGRIAAFGLANLEDDKQFFPVYNAAPVVRKAVLDQYPEIAQILKPMADQLTTGEMQTLNKAVDVDHLKISDVAKQWLKEKKLI